MKYSAHAKVRSASSGVVPGPMAAPPDADSPARVTVTDYTALISGDSFLGPGLSGMPVFLTYSFEDAPADYLGLNYTPDQLATFRPLSESQRAIARDAFAQWAAVSGITFFEAPSGQGDIAVAAWLSLGALGQPAAGFATYPDFTNAFFGDVFLSTGALAQRAAMDPALVGALIIHEIGHALGLKHPFDPPTTLAPEVDNSANTVMAYIQAPGYPGNVLGPLDIAAIQSLYGTNAQDGTQVASWSWNATSFVLTQTAGAGDDVIGGVGARDVIYASAGNDRIATRNGDDEIHGGEGADIINGGEGDDTLFGDAGDDQLAGGSGVDGAFGGDGDDFISFDPATATEFHADGGSGSDSLYITYIERRVGPASYSLQDALDAGATITGVESVFLAVYGSGPIFVEGSAGNERINGAGASVHFRGLAGDDYLDAREGDDTLDGGDGADILTGGDGDDILIGGAGGDYIIGGAGFDIASYAGEQSGINATVNGAWLVSPSQTENLTQVEGLIGSSFADRLTGDAGDNLLYGGAGDDTLAGGAGGDIFRFTASGQGVDTIEDFSIAEDRFDLGGGLFSAVQNAGGVTTLTYAGGSIRIPGVVESSLAVWNARVRADITLSAGADTHAGGAGVDVVFGGAGIDTLNGAGGLDRLFGQDGDDVLSGGDGADTLEGGSGIDTLDGGAGADTLRGGAGDDIYILTDAADLVEESAGGGTDTVRSSVDYTLPDNVENLELTGSSLRGYGNDLNNTIRVDDSGVDRIFGGAGDDVLIGGANHDFMEGGAGDDRLIGGARDDSMIGGSGDDIYEVEGFDFLVELEGGGYDIVLASTDFFLIDHIEEVRLVGSARNVAPVNATTDMRILGNALDNELSGGWGADVLIGGAGADRMIGEQSSNPNGPSGVDRASYSTALTGVVANLSTASQNTGEAAGDTYIAIDDLEGSAFNDRLVGDSASNWLIGLSGDDILNGGAGSDRLSGDAGDDVIEILTGNFTAGEIIDGGAGVDTLRTVGGVDFRGGSLVSIDRIAFNREGAEATLNIIVNATQIGAGLASDLVLSGSAGQDSVQIFVGSGATVDIGGWGFDFPNWFFDDYVVYVGDAGSETMRGFGGLDIFFGSPGEDVYDGRGAFDFAAYLFSPNAVQADLAISGRQQIGGNQNFDTFINLEGLAGSQFSDLLYGDGGANIILGLYGNDLLVGRAGDDDLRGAEGSDRIEGGMGADVLWGFTDLAGGADGADTFVYRSAAEGGDTIRDFMAGHDLIEVSASGFGGGLVAGQAVQFTSGVNPVASGAGGRFLYNTSNGQLAWDADGSGAGGAVVLATFLGNPALSAGSIIVTGIAASAALDDAQPPSAFAAEGDDVAEQDTFDFNGVGGGIAAAPSHAPQAFGGGGAFGLQVGAWAMADPLDTFAFADGVGGFMSGEIGASLADMLDLQRGALGPDAMSPI